MDHNQERQHDQSQTAGSDIDNEPAAQPPQGFPPFPPLSETDAKPKHSGPGIASFVLGILNILLVIVGFVVIIAGVADYISPDGTLDEDFMNSMDAALLTGTFMVLGALALSLVGTILGIVAVAVKNRRKAFGIVGLVLNALLLLGVIVLMLIGLAIQGAAA